MNNKQQEIERIEERAKRVAIEEAARVGFIMRLPDDLFEKYKVRAMHVGGKRDHWMVTIESNGNADVGIEDVWNLADKFVPLYLGYAHTSTRHFEPVVEDDDGILNLMWAREYGKPVKMDYYVCPITLRMERFGHGNTRTMAQFYALLGMETIVQFRIELSKDKGEFKYLPFVRGRGVHKHNHRFWITFSPIAPGWSGEKINWWVSDKENQCHSQYFWHDWQDEAWRDIFVVNKENE